MSKRVRFAQPPRSAATSTIGVVSSAPFDSLPRDSPNASGAVPFVLRFPDRRVRPRRAKLIGAMLSAS